MNEAAPVNLGASKNGNSFPWTVIILAVVVLAPILFVASIPLQVMYRADAGFRKAKKTIDPEQLRAWALAAVKSHNGTNGYSHSVKNSELPDYIVNLYSIPPEMAWVSPQMTDQDELVGIVWGGGFFHWGFYIGTTNYVMGPFGDHVTAEWTRGIYYAHEGSRKIR